MNLILLGAGASYDSFSKKGLAPPLGNGVGGLFDRLLEHSDIAKYVDSRLFQLFRDNFEQGMQEFDRHIDNDQGRFQLELGRYLSSFVAAEDNAYNTLLASTVQAETVFASLNYDTLLEECILNFARRRVNYNLDLLPLRTRVLKPHGSSNFWPTFPPATITGVRFRGSSTDVQAPITPVSPQVSRARYLVEDCVGPSMAVYGQKKIAKTSQDFLVTQQQNYALAVSLACRIVVIGVRVTPHDNHIWGPLLSAKPAVNYFGLRNDRAEFDTWAANRNGASIFHEMGFSECFDALHSILTT